METTNPRKEVDESFLTVISSYALQGYAVAADPDEILILAQTLQDLAAFLGFPISADRAAEFLTLEDPAYVPSAHLKYLAQMIQAVSVACDLYQQVVLAAQAPPPVLEMLAAPGKFLQRKLLHHRFCIAAFFHQ